MQINTIGKGAGSQELPIPNILRAIIGEDEDLKEEQNITIIETNIDDMNPEFYSYIIDYLFEAGAIDCSIIPVIMKKGRPGNILQVTSPDSLVSTISQIIIKESSTLGVRFRKEKGLFQIVN